MSRIGNKPIELPEGVEAAVNKHVVTVNGPKGELTVEYKAPIVVKVEDKKVVVTRPNDSKINKALHGLYRSLINNLVVGVTEGYSKDLEIKGIGYRAQVKGNDLEMSLGYSHPIIVTAPEGITITVVDATKIKVEGIDKQLVGQIASVIKSKRKVEPYKGKGIRYVGEHVRRKAGKAGKTAE